MHREIAAVGLLVCALPLGAAAQVTALGSTHPETLGGFGTSCASIPDINGDGKQDIVVGASNETVQAKLGAGRVYIYNGASGALIKVLISPQFEEQGGFGMSVSGVPDVNGDGRGDILVGAYNEGNSGLFYFDGHGRAYLFSGATGTWLRTINSPNPESGGFFGIAVAGVEDLNGDGRGEAAVGAWTEDPGAAPQDSGKVYIFRGNNGALLRSLSSPAPAIAGSFGVALAAVPDLTGDGKQDLIVAATGEDVGLTSAAGRVHVYNGGTGAFVRTLVSPNKEVGGGFGRSVAGVLDSTGDAKGDILIGAPTEDPGASPNNCGRAYHFNGATGALLKAFAPGAPEADGGFGYSVSGLPDINADGRGDAVIGANGMDPGGAAYGGRVFIYSGAGGAWIKTLFSPKQGEESGFGTGIAALTDTGGNGKGEVIVGSPAEDAANGTNEAGRAYLFRN